jgi:hypothetical protein
MEICLFAEQDPMDICLSAEQEPQNPYHPPPILTISKRLFFQIISFMDKKYLSAVAFACKDINNCYKLVYGEKPLVFLDSQKFDRPLCPYYSIELRRCWDQTCCVCTKVKITEAPVNSQDYDDTHPAEMVHFE